LRQLNEPAGDGKPAISVRMSADRSLSRDLVPALATMMFSCSAAIFSEKVVEAVPQAT
jgi:hypothetical protein